ncbi:hypothetical protein MMC20_001336 [Loxospora ochrophaea]|nr:hypothetical protein [Loxospora ochrophaea]
MENRDSLDRSSSEVATSLHVANASLSGENELQSNAGDLTVSEPSVPDESARIVDGVLQSDIGVNTLLTRLKQSIASARDFASFLKKRSTLEEEHAQGLRKLCRSSHESSRRPDNRQGSYAQNYEEITRIHERMVDNGVQFALALHQMHEDLHDLATNMERGRKQWKQTGLTAEKRVQDAEIAMDKAKTKYDSLAEDYDRAKTGDRQSGRVFGLKGPKSAAQVEEDLSRKVQAADSDYSSKVQAAQGLRRDLLATSRPQTVKALLDLINECDSGLTFQMQKFGMQPWQIPYHAIELLTKGLASLNEKLLLGNGLCVSPLKAQINGQAPQPRSLRDVVLQIDNERDLKNYLLSFSSRAGPRHPDLSYQRHPTLAPTQQAPPANRQPQPAFQPQASSPQNGRGFTPSYNQTPQPTLPQPAEKPYDDSPQQQIYSPISPAGPPQLPAPSFSSANFNQSSTTSLPNRTTTPSDLPPLKPVFGISLEDLFQRDGSAVPMVVYQCLQAVDLFGLEVEGIYRLSGTTSHVAKLRAVFDNAIDLQQDSSQVDFRNPESFYHDVNSVAGLLKQFFRDLPDPLLTREHYQAFIEAARIDDDITRRDSLHATINSLPDPNYATLRALTLVSLLAHLPRLSMLVANVVPAQHLNRVQEHFAINRMNAGNLAICFGYVNPLNLLSPYSPSKGKETTAASANLDLYRPTLMGSNSGPNIADAGWQVRVIDTILQNTYQIFDDD